LLKTLDVDSKINGFVKMEQPALPFLGSGLGYLASKLRKNLSPLFL
jgi:hypothetical protein